MVHKFFEILGARRVMRSKFSTNVSYMLRANAQYLIATAKWGTEFVHPF